MSSKVFLLTLLWFLPALALACPNIDGLRDRNCDGRLHIAVVGDSIVSGEGDEAHGGSGGYVLRLGEQLPHAVISSYGFPGYTAAGLLKLFTRVRRNVTRGDWKLDIGTADYVIVDAGRNDYFAHRSSATVASTLRSLAGNLELLGESVQGLAPLVAVSSLASTNRGKQQDFLRHVNYRIQDAVRKRRLIAGPRFDSVQGLSLNRDGLHPTAAGYDRLEFVLESYLRVEAQQVP